MDTQKSEQRELHGEELAQQCEDFGHPMMGNACPCGKRVDWRGL